VIRIPGFRSSLETRGTGCPANWRYWLFQRLLGFNRSVPWPVHFTSRVQGTRWIRVGYNTAPGASIGNYIFAKEDAPISVGHFTVIASGVCLAAYNHDVHDISAYTHKGGISIGDYCWIAANAVIVSGVRLGDHTVVAAGAVVTSSFEQGHCVLAGNPARVVKRLDPGSVVRFSPAVLYHGWRRVGSPVQVWGSAGVPPSVGPGHSADSAPPLEGRV
jgi:carbonic anhydrase/acetyltransferase-like protein (isoleucine patch superfamily)